MHRLEIMTIPSVGVAAVFLLMTVASPALAGDLTVPISTTITLPGGSHYYDNITVGYGGTLKLTGPATIRCRRMLLGGRIQISGDTTIEVTYERDDPAATGYALRVGVGSSSYPSISQIFPYEVQDGADAPMETYGGAGGKGDSGMDGYDLTLIVHGDMYVDGSFSVNLNGQDGGDGGDGGDGLGPGNTPPFNTEWQCEDGGPGGPGGDGGSGGNGGSLNVVVSGDITSSLFYGSYFRAYVNGGAAGRAGGGGGGGQGGQGWLYTGDPDCACPPGNGGPGGPPGQTGTFGSGGSVSIFANNIMKTNGTIEAGVTFTSNDGVGGTGGSGGGPFYLPACQPPGDRGPSTVAGQGAAGGAGGDVVIRASCGLKFGDLYTGTIDVSGGTGGGQGYTFSDANAHSTAVGGNGGSVFLKATSVEKAAIIAAGGTGGMGGGTMGYGNNGADGGGGGSTRIDADSLLEVTTDLSGGAGGEGGYGDTASGLPGTPGSDGSYNENPVGGDFFDLQLSVEQAEASPGDLVDYHVTVSSGTPRSGVVVSLDEPNHMEYASSFPAGTVFPDGHIEFAAGDLDACAGTTFHVVARVTDLAVVDEVVGNLATAVDSGAASAVSNGVSTKIVDADAVALENELGDKPDESVAEPVHTGTGNYYLGKSLFRFPGRGLSFDFKLSYNSRGADSDGPLGFGWTHSYNIALTDSAGEVSIRWGDGHRDFFRLNGAGGYDPVNSHTYVKLTRPDPGHYLATFPDGAGFRFDSAGLLLDITDLNGNQVVLTHTTQLDSITDSSGRQIDFTYAGGRISAVTSPLKAGSTASFSYDGSGNLTAIVDPGGGSWSFTYDAGHRILTYTDANGNTVASNTYDTSGRVVEQLDALGGLTTFAYTDTSSGVETLVTPPSGSAAWYHYDRAYNLVKVIDAGGEEASFGRDSQGRATILRDKNGEVETRVYDGSGNLTQTIDRNGAASSASYNELNRPLSIRDSRGKTTSFLYDAAGNLTRVTNPNGGQADIAYGPGGLPSGYTNALGRTHAYTYTAEGLLESATDPLGGTTSLAYDAAGRVVQVTAPDGAVTQVTYDDNGRILGRTDPLGNTTSYGYDGNGNLLQVVGPTGAVTTHAYDALNRRTSTTDPLGGVTTYGYDVDGNLVGVTDADGVGRSFEYDGANRLTAVVSASGGRTLLGYDAGGRLVSAEGPTGDVFDFEYDADGRPLARVSPLGGRSSASYDSTGMVVGATSASGAVTTYARGNMGEETGRTLPGGATIAHAYDAMGNIATLTDPRGQTWQFLYDELDRMVSATDPAGLAVAFEYDSAGRISRRVDRSGREISYAYDLLGRLTTVTLPGPETVSYAYDAAGNLLTVTDPSGTVAMTYDLAGRRLTRTGGDGRTIAYTYTPAGRPDTVTYPGGKVVDYQYDAFGRLATITDWLSQVTSFEYDAFDRVTGIGLPNGTRTEYLYDADGRVAGMTHRAPGGSPLRQYAYTRDAGGRITEVSAAGGATPVPGTLVADFTYDAANRTLTATEGGVVTDYVFDSDGNLVSRAKGGGATTTYGYDPLNRLVSVADGTNTTTCEYDGLGDRVAKTWNGVERRHLREGGEVYGTYDSSGGEVELFVRAGPVLYGVGAGGLRVYHPDERGSVAVVTDGAGAEIASYLYDPYGRVTGGTPLPDSPFRFVGTRGVMTDENGLLHMQARYYDPLTGRFLSEDPLGVPAGINLYEYAGGDPVNRIDPEGLFARGAGDGVTLALKGEGEGGDGEGSEICPAEEESILTVINRFRAAYGHNKHQLIAIQRMAPVPQGPGPAFFSRPWFRDKAGNFATTVTLQVTIYKIVGNATFAELAGTGGLVNAGGVWAGGVIISGVGGWYTGRYLGEHVPIGGGKTLDDGVQTVFRGFYNYQSFDTQYLGEHAYVQYLNGGKADGLLGQLVQAGFDPETARILEASIRGEIAKATEYDTNLRSLDCGFDYGYANKCF